MSFRSCRKAAGLTQAAVCRHFDISDSAVAQWENGKTQPKAKLLPEIAALYGCTIDDLFKEDEDHTHS